MKRQLLYKNKTTEQSKTRENENQKKNKEKQNKENRKEIKTNEKIAKLKQYTLKTNKHTNKQTEKKKLFSIDCSLLVVMIRILDQTWCTRERGMMVPHLTAV